MATLYAVIMAGGSGTRFWPASRRGLPKQLLPIAPREKKTLIAATVRRIEELCPPERTLIATGAHLVDATQKALPWLPESSFLGEPVARNTAACIGWATSLIRREDDDAVVMVLPSDHHVGDETAFRAALEKATASAVEGPITTIGITPTRPETGYGYIKTGEEVGDGVRRVERFVEKPDTHRAKQYLASGDYAWNSGMFFFRADVMLNALAEHMKPLSDGLARIGEAASRGEEEERTETKAVFESLESISIDYGVMEKVSPINVVPAQFGWSDIGSWQSAYELAEHDAADNAADERVVLVKARGNLVRDLRSDGKKRVIAVLGVEDLCVIETDDALLVMPRRRSQEVRKMVDELQLRGGEYEDVL